ncbi:hypothetical protein ELBI_100 [Anabaena phage Elbi]|nr:hypothetical protein ELBI_100 [Anabaena phage Elbi]
MKSETTKQETKMITFSEVQTITVENLQDNFTNGVMTWCEPDQYVRGSINPEDVEEKKAALSFTEDGVKYVEVLEPLVFYRRGDVLHLLNGNNRVTAIFEMLNSKDTKSLEYKPVPYRILESEPSTTVLEELQVVANDTTTAHSPYQLSRRIAASAARLEAEYRANDPKIKKNALGSKVLDDLCNIYKRQHHYIRNLLRVSEQPESVQSLLEKDLISANTVVEIAKKLPKDASDEYVSEVYQELAKIAGDAKITEKHLNQWLDSKKPEKPTTEGTGEGEGEGDNETPKPAITIEEFSAATIDRFNKLSVIDNRHITPKLKPQVSQVIKSGLSLLTSTFDIFTDDQSMELLDDVKAIVFKRLGDVDALIQRCENAGEEIPAIYKKFASFNKNVDKLYKGLTESEEPETGVTLIESDGMEAEIQALS